jgi:hypothetical protein
MTLDHDLLTVRWYYTSFFTKHDILITGLSFDLCASISELRLLAKSYLRLKTNVIA